MVGCTFVPDFLTPATCPPCGDSFPDCLIFLLRYFFCFETFLSLCAPFFFLSLSSRKVQKDEREDPSIPLRLLLVSYHFLSCEFIGIGSSSSSSIFRAIPSRGPEVW